ncbi:thioredoxin [Paenibacillus sp. GD4]|uniref:thioredoxin n=1 Tax=Paenibacillus TaxID=44249 RepID=UPI00254279BF|nr:MULTISPECIES: thioredoxin [Paenibacillus]MDQ1910605.1 thioredoxin [Paenibacillus sp. GD4]
MAITNVNDAVFKETIQEGVVLVDFWAPWCGPCKMIAPILEELNGELGDKITIAKVNVDDNPETAGAYGIMSIPTLKLFKDGKEVGSAVGLRPLQELKALIEPHLS